MSHYQRQLLLSASPATVYHAIAAQQGLRGWWTQTCEVSERVGGRSSFNFNRTYKVMENTSLVPGREVHWHCVEAHIDAASLQRRDEWVGTDIIFRLSAMEGGKTRVDFEHVGLTPEVECFELCEAGWNQFLGSLKNLVETGHGSPFVSAETACHADAAVPA